MGFSKPDNLFNSQYLSHLSRQARDSVHQCTWEFVFNSFTCSGKIYVDWWSPCRFMFIMPADSTLKSHLLALLEVSVKCMFTRLINHVENSTWNLHLKSTWILKDRCGFSAQIFYKTAQWSLVQICADVNLPWEDSAWILQQNPRQEGTSCDFKSASENSTSSSLTWGLPI